MHTVKFPAELIEMDVPQPNPYGQPFEALDELRDDVKK